MNDTLKKDSKTLSQILEALALASEPQSDMSAEDAMRIREENIRFRSEKMTDIVWTVDRDFRVTYVSPSIVNVLGFTPEERKKQSIEEMVTPQSLHTVYETFLKEILREEEGPVDLNRSVTLELEYYHKDGSTVWLENSVKAMRNSEGAIVGMFGVSRDITELKRAEEDRLLLEQQFHQTQKSESLGRMAGAIAHHFNNLFGAVMGNLELALEDLPVGSGPSENISEAIKAIRRAAEISGLLLAYLGQGRGKKEPIDLVAVCLETLDLLRAAMPKTVCLKTKICGRGPIVRADAAKLRQALSNLIVNSREAAVNGIADIVVALSVMPASKIRSLRFYPVDWEPQTEFFACISVADTGCGMDSAILEKIFDPFFSTKFTDRGLGLAVVLGVARTHGGAVSVESEPGKGSKFSIILPISKQEEISLPKPDMVDSCSITVQGLVMLVEDEAMVRDMTRVMLKRLGHDVVAAADGVEAMDVFRTHLNQIQCVLLDLTMPRRDGWKTLAALRALRPDLPVVLTSGYDEAQAMQEEHAEQPQVFLHKPFRMAELRAALHAAMHWSEVGHGLG
ncbi:MAG: response regulator [Deltaproteobacteria bacterium]|nr:response regulator [Deltaproteobacteria bacterium]